MSTSLRDVTPTLLQTRFFGGRDRGPCVQVTQTQMKSCVASNPQGVQFLQLTRTEAALLAAELLRFATGNEVEEV
jgi:hypothetical protein